MAKSSSGSSPLQLHQKIDPKKKKKKLAIKHQMVILLNKVWF
jgi:hypothetical protein